MERVVLVTGSSSGIGREIVRKLAGDYEVIIQYNNVRHLKEPLKIYKFYLLCIMFIKQTMYVSICIP